jgi:predicted aspartyl protease
VGTFFERITLIGPAGVQETFQGMVDTGAMFTVIPTAVLERLGVRPIDAIPMRFASGQEDRWQLGQVDAELNGHRRPILCLFGSPDAPPLIGAHTLEAFLLMVDPVEQKLVPKEALLMPVAGSLDTSYSSRL